jgi:hypothetical protein
MKAWGQPDIIAVAEAADIKARLGRWLAGAGDVLLLVFQPGGLR